jgi:23S rRNA (uracil1939-C5)-methyltransferase
MRRSPAEPVEVVVESLGGRGDGIAVRDGRRLFVPLALPGDRVRVRPGAAVEGGFRAEPVAWLERAPRALPPCPHFGTCGGCALQHLPGDAYAAWIVERIRTALARRGLEAPIEPPRISPPGSRRRARLAYDGRSLGLRARRSRRVVDLAVCPVLRPELEAILSPLRDLLSGLDGRVPEVSPTLTDAGIDLLLHAAGAPALADRERLAAFAESLDLARVTWGGEPIVTRRPPSLRLGPLTVDVPPGAFLQATAEGEKALAAEVARGLEGARRVVDLFAGLGALTLPLLETGAAIRAVDADSGMIAALRGAAAGHRVVAEARDLERRPLQPGELDADGVVLDPPRAGARAQAEALARAPVRRLVMASCHPPSFARDARILTGGGWRLQRVVPIAQFLWSAEVELAATFARWGSDAHSGSHPGRPHRTSCRPRRVAT